MTTRLIAPPAALAVSLAAARSAARVDVDQGGTSALDGDITQAVKAIAGEVEHMIGRALITQTWRLTLDSFPAVFCLSAAPLIAVTSIKYYDISNVQQTLAPSAYIVDAASEPARIVPAAGAYWPATEVRPSAVEVVYTCGFGADDTAIPDGIKQYILLRVQQQFAPVSTAKPDDFCGLLDRWRTWS